MLVMPVFLHCMSAGREGPLWIHLRCWTAWLCEHVPAVEPYEHERSVSCVRDECLGLLPSPHGPPFGSLTSVVTTVSNTHVHTHTHTHAHTPHTHTHTHTHTPHTHTHTHTPHTHTHTALPHCSSSRYVAVVLVCACMNLCV